MNKFFAVLAALAVTAFAAPAAFADDTYVAVNAGTSIAAVEGLNLDDGAAVGVAVGRDFGLVRGEVAVTRASNDTNFLGLELGVNALEYSATAFYDFDGLVGDRVTPYVGAGVTYTDAEAEILFTDIDAQGWGYQLAGGFRAQVSDRITADVGVRWGESTLDASFFGDVDVETARLQIGGAIAL